jgi:hypothetical protein
MRMCNLRLLPSISHDLAIVRENQLGVGGAQIEGQLGSVLVGTKVIGSAIIVGGRSGAV